MLLLLMALLLVPGAAWAQAAGIERYEYGDYEAAARLFEQDLANTQRPPAGKALTLSYLASSLYALGQEEAARKWLEVLAREHPEQRVDPARFSPEVVALAELTRQQVESERQREEARRRMNASASRSLRPEVYGLFDAVDRHWALGGGIAFQRDSLEGGLRVVLADPPVFQLQGGVLPGRGASRLFLGLRASLLPGVKTYGAGPVIGGRIALPAGLVAVVDLGADYFFTGRDDRRRLAVTAQVGLGFNLNLR
ncbi:MAG TPA: hypothetical protein VK539_07820 [Myxococcaceae bacterium]|nr:hypothetical protein [Myxococcaceae bacterium]